MATKCWTDAYRWRKDASNQVRIRAADNINVVVRRHVGGHLNDARASSLIDKFLNFSFLTYDEYTHLSNNVCILREDESRPELYNYTCMANAKEFTCKHSVGIAMRRHTMIATPAAIITLLGRKRKRGRRPLAAGASEYQPFDILTSPAHPLQDPDIIAGLAPPNLDVVAEEAAAVYNDIIHE